MDIETRPLEDRVKQLEDYVDYLYFKLIELENFCGVVGQQPPVRVNEKEIIECSLDNGMEIEKKKPKLNRNNAFFINE